MGKPYCVRRLGNYVVFKLDIKSSKDYSHLDIIVDCDDFENLINNTNCWYFHKDTCNAGYYIRRNIGGKKTRYLHADIVDEMNLNYHYDARSCIIDHIDNNQLNNSRENLRIVDAYTNRRNTTRVPNVSPYRGCSISLVHKNIYQAYLRKNGLNIYMGASRCLLDLKAKIDAKLRGFL